MCSDGHTLARPRLRLLSLTAYIGSMPVQSSQVQITNEFIITIASMYAVVSTSSKGCLPKADLTCYCPGHNTNRDL